jgi:ribosomal protein S6--L-glutamate ligase
MHFGVVVENRYLAQSQPAGLINALKERGHEVSIIDPQKTSYSLTDDRWMKGIDLLACRGRSYGLMCLMEWAEKRGITAINRKSAIASVYNKADMAVALATAGIRTPQTFLGNVECLANEIEIDSYPLILKPIFGDNSQGLLVVRAPEDLARVTWQDPVALAQSYIPTDGYDLKLYGVGDKIWPVRKPSPFNKPADDGSRSGEVPLTRELEELGRRCGEIFGLELYGVDCIETPDGPLVIEINDYPNYTGVPRANETLADYIISRAEKGA